MIIGIDPGFKGAIASLDEKGKLISITDIPSYSVKTATRVDIPKNKRAEGGPKTKMVNKSKSFVDNKKLFKDIKECDSIIVEIVAARPGQGSCSMFNFGKIYGAILAIADNKTNNLVHVRPIEWQEHFGVTMCKKDKEDLTPAQVTKIHKKKIADKAQEIYPEAELYTKRGALKDGRADALLIARYLFETNLGE